MTKTMWSPHPAPLLPCHIAIYYVFQTPFSYMFSKLPLVTCGPVVEF